MSRLSHEEYIALSEPEEEVVAKLVGKWGDLFAVVGNKVHKWALDTLDWHPASQEEAAAVLAEEQAGEEETHTGSCIFCDVGATCPGHGVPDA